MPSSRTVGDRRAFCRAPTTAPGLDRKEIPTSLPSLGWRKKQKQMTADSSPLQLPFMTTRVIVISDFNCPYCFTLNEWVESFGAGGRIRWVGIEHRPDLPTHGDNRPEDQVQLQKEVDDVQKRAPEVGLVRPAVWSNSRSALLVQNALEDEAPGSEEWREIVNALLS